MTQQIIKASLNKTDGGNMLLTFQMSTGQASINLDNENDGEQIKQLFAKILEEMYKGPITIEPVIPADHTGNLYGIVSKTYIEQLNAEIQRVQPKIDELKNKEPEGSDN